MKLQTMLDNLKTIYQKTTLLEGTVHLVKGAWKMTKVLILSAYWRHNFRKVGNNLTIFPQVKVDFPKNVAVGDDFSLNQGTYLRSENDKALFQAGNRVDIGMHCHIDYSGGITLGDRVVISGRASLHTHNHGTSAFNPPVYKPLRIEDEVWIADGATIMPQVSIIGEHAVIGANALVTKDVRPYTVVGGNPARVIKELERPRGKRKHG